MTKNAFVAIVTKVDRNHEVQFIGAAPFHSRSDAERYGRNYPAPYQVSIVQSILEVKA